MTREAELLAADAARRDAMVRADAAALAPYLSETLVWTHSSGRTDDKPAVLEAIASRSVRYLALDAEDVHVAEHGDIYLMHGTVRGRVSKDGAQRALANKFLSVWQRRASSFEMLAWQSTGL